MYTLRFLITRTNGTKETAAIDGKRAVIGHGAHCDVRLNLDEAAYEHVAIDCEGDEVFAAAMVAAPAVTVDGGAITRRALTPDDTLAFAGGVTVRVTLESEAAKAGNGGAAARRIGILAALTLVFVVFLLAKGRKSAAAEAPRELPQIFEAAATGCPQNAPDQAEALADERYALAEVRRERYPFVPHDGVAAVALYEQAAACFRAARDATSVTASDNAARSLRSAITLDVRARLLRLEYSARAHDLGLAAQDLQVLRSVVDGSVGGASFSSYLDDVQRRLQAK